MLRYCDKQLEAARLRAHAKCAILPTLIGAAAAYAVSGDASASADQRLHEEAEAPALGAESSRVANAKPGETASQRTQLSQAQPSARSVAGISTRE